MRNSLSLLASVSILGWAALGGTSEVDAGEYLVGPPTAVADPAYSVSEVTGEHPYCASCQDDCCDPCGRGCGRQGCAGRLAAKWAEAGYFNCRCRGSYKFPVLPQYTYHWPGMYAQQTMTEYSSPYRFPPLNPPEDVFSREADENHNDSVPVAPEETATSSDAIPQSPAAPVAQPGRSAEPNRLPGVGGKSVDPPTTSELMKQFYGVR